MSTRITIEQLVEIVDGDNELIENLREFGIIAADADEYLAIDIDRVLVSRTLVRELEVNYAGVDIILRLREEIVRMRQRSDQDD